MKSPLEQFQAARGSTEPLPLDSLLESPDDAAGPQEGKTHGTGREVWNTGSNPLTKRQKAVLCQIAARAFNQLEKLGLTDGLKLTEWRRREQLETVGQASLTNCRQHHYRKLRGHFQSLASGKPSPATFQDNVSTPENADRQYAVRRLREALARLAQAKNVDRPPMGDAGAQSYALTIALSQSRNKNIGSVAQIENTWQPERIERLAYTLNNRARAISKVGKTRNRNKSQRKR